MLADRGIYLASESTLYRALEAEDQLHHRSGEKPRGTYSRPISYSEASSEGDEVAPLLVTQGISFLTIVEPAIVPV